MAYNQQLSVLGQVAPATTGTAGQVLVSAGSSASSYWASAIPVSAYSAQFNGSSYLSVPNNTAFDFGSGNFTIETWIYLTGYSAAYTGGNYGASILSKDGSGSTVRSITFQLLGTASSWTSIYCALFTNDSTLVSTPATYTFALNTWYHVACVRNSGTLTIYINGVSGGSGSNPGTIQTTSSPVTIGYENYVGAFSYQYYFPGFMSNYRVVKGVAVYTGAFTPPTSPLGTSQAAGTNIAAVTPSQVSLLTCNGPGLIDSSINAFTITNVSGTSITQFAPFSSFSAISRSASQTQTILTSGSGTYYTPSGVAWLRIRMVGGGAGGTAGGGGGVGSPGISTTFGLFTAGGGSASPGQTAYGGGIGGTASGGNINLTGGGGGAGPASYSSAQGVGGLGGASVFGGAGFAGGAYSNVNGGAAGTNTGGGGGGGAVNSQGGWGGGGGGSGGYVESYITSLAASYAYTVGAGGGGGTGGATTGGGGGSGIIIVEENYAVSVTSSNYTITYLMVAGGGSGGGYGGGGGAGGLLTGLASLIPSINYPITVGSGGAASATTTNGNPGNNSSLFGLSGGTITAIGGGYGGGNAGTSSGQTGGNGGSGGGASHGASTSVATTGGSGTSGQGNAGGTGLNGNGSSYGEGGGGGAGAVGGNYAGTAGGAGGIGIASTITGSSVYYAGGGGGFGGGSSGAGGTGGGGAGGSTSPVAGTVNTGGGGGGGGGAAGGAAGGSGVVILSIPTSNYTGITTGSPTVTTSGSYKILTFTQSGSYTA
jgi:hypothetical protein